MSTFGFSTDELKRTELYTGQDERTDRYVSNCGGSFNRSDQTAESTAEHTYQSFTGDWMKMRREVTA